MRTACLLTVAACAVAGCTVAEPADLLLANGVVLGSEPEPLAAPGWVTVGGGRIVDAGSGSPPPARRVVDLGGRVLAPAFVDHHAHLLNVGLSLVNRDAGDALYLDLSAVGSLEELAAAVAARAAAQPDGTWILGKGWSQGAWGSVALPDRETLDAVAPEQPVFLSRADGHAGWVNTAALKAAGLSAATADPSGGKILRRPDGEPTGVLLERANEPVLALLPRPDDAAIREAFRRAADAFAALGVTDAYDAGFLTPPGVVGLNDDLGRYLALLAEEDQARPLAVRVRLMVPAPSALAEEMLTRPEEYRRPSPRVRVTHLKLFADGALGSRGGSLSHPFADDPATSGVPRMSQEEILDWAGRALDAGLDVATHAIGDAAVATVLDAYEELLRERAGLDARRLRIEHFSYARAEDFDRAAALGVVASIQPDFVLPGDDGRAMEDARLGESSDRVYAWGRLHRAGALLAGGSDYFTFPGGPMLGFHSAAYRSNENGLPVGGWHGAERLSPGDAWRLFVTHYGLGGEAPEVRSVKAGARAELVVLSADPFRAAETELPGIVVHATISDGEVTFSDGSLTGLETAAGE